MFSWIFFAVFFFFFALAVSVGILKGRKYIWQFSLARLITVVVSLALSLVLAIILSGILGGVVANLIKGVFASNETVSELLTALPSAMPAIKALVATVIAPLLFIIFFVIAKPLLALLKKPIAGLMTKKTEADEAESEEKPVKNAAFRSKKKFDIGGASLGAACALVAFIAICAPVVFYLQTANLALSFAGDALPAVITDISEGAAENPASKAVNILGGDLLVGSMTRAKVDGEAFKLKNELNYVSSLGNAVTKLGDKGAPENDAANALRETTAAFEKSTLVPTLASEFVNAASYDFGRHKPFCGINAPELGEDFEPAMLSLYDSLGASSKQTIRDDYRTIINVAALAIEHDALTVLKGEGDKLHLFKDEELVSGIMLEMFNNDRLSGTIEGFANAGIKIIAHSLGVYDDADALYAGFIGDMQKEYKAAYAVGSKSERLNSLTAAVDKTYAYYGIELSEGVSECIALSMLDNGGFANDNDTKAFFGATGGSAQISVNGAYSADMLASSAEPKSIALAKKAVALAKGSNDSEHLAKSLGELLGKNSDFFASLSEEDRLLLEASIASKLFGVKENGGEYKYEGAAFANANELYHASVRLTLDELYISISDISDKEAEARSLAKVLSSAVDISDKISASDGDIVEVIKSFGPILDSVCECKSIGEKGTSELITIMMQSDKVQNEIGFTVIQSTNVANTINNSAHNGESYSDILLTVGQTVKIIKDSADNKDTTESVKELMEDLTPASAETLKQLSTPETVMNYGVPEENAKKVSGVLSDMFGQMSDAKEKGMSEDQYQAEAEAVNDMVNIAMNVGKAEEGETIFGKDSVTGITPTEYVDRVIGSTVISNTIVNAAYDASEDKIENDPLGMARELNESEKSELVGALDSEWKSHLASSATSAETREKQKLLSSISALLGVEVEFSGDKVIAK